MVPFRQRRDARCISRFLQRVRRQPFLGARGDAYIYISAGTLDQPTGLKTIGHIWLGQAGDYYELTDDLEKYELDSNGQFVANED